MLLQCDSDEEALNFLGIEYARTVSVYVLLFFVVLIMSLYCRKMVNLQECMVSYGLLRLSSQPLRARFNNAMEQLESLILTSSLLLT